MPELLPLRDAEQVSEDDRALRIGICSHLEGIDKRLKHSSPATSVSLLQN